MTQQPPPRRTDWLSLLFTFLLLAWIAGVSYVVQFGAALLAVSPGEFSLPPDMSLSQIMFRAALVQAVLLLVPLAPLAFLWRAPRYRAIFRAWFAASLLLLALAPARLLPTTAPQLTLLVQGFLLSVFSLALWLLTGRGALLERASPVAAGIAAALGILLLLPWVLWGALGSVGDIVLGILNALAFALAVTLLLTRVWLRGYAPVARGAGEDSSAGSPPLWRGRSIALGGFVAGALLLILASGIGFNGTQLLFMFALPAWGWFLVTLIQTGSRHAPGWNDRALWTAAACAVAPPLLFLDPDTGILLASLGDGEALTYALYASGVVILAAWLSGLVLFFLRRPLAGSARPAFAWLGAGLAAALALIVYFTLGQPGLFGDRVFVILKHQADVSSAKTIAAYDERRAFVYKTLTRHAGETQRDLRATLDALRISYTPYYLVNALEVEADLPLQWWLVARGDVDRVLPSPRMRPLPYPPPVSRGSDVTPPATPQWNLTLIGADRVWNELGVRGAGILVGQSDSGADGSHPELAAQYRGRDGANDYNWLDPWNHSVSPQDIGGHGTHTLGSILGKTVGVAPDAEWIGCVNLARNLGNPALYLDCMQFNFAPFPQAGDALRDGDPERGAMVLNNSWGCPDVEGCDPNALLRGVRALRDAGVFVVASAGNDGPVCSSVKEPLALYDDVFSVGAVNRFKQLAQFSSRGPVESDGSGRVKPDISAPGVEVMSSLPGGTYGANSGTSMAGPHIVGVVALLWSANPKLIGDIDATETILRETAQPVDVSAEGIVCGDPNATPNDLVGYGIVDAYAAVKRALAEK